MRREVEEHPRARTDDMAGDEAKFAAFDSPTPRLFASSTSGFINLLKPPGMTSHDAVVFVRRQWGIARVGHLGTLDPAAAGVLPISLGRATRLFDYAGKSEKAYRAEIVFGLTTDTLDAEGRVISTADASDLTEARLRALLAAKLGEEEQRPPAFSAAQVGGKRLHELARQGKSVTAPPRKVRFLELSLLDFQPGPQARARVEVVCSAGAYLRVFAEDLGKEAGCGAYLAFLLRTRSGSFRLEEAVSLEELAAGGERYLLPPDWPLSDLPRVELERRAAAAFVTGTCVRAGAVPAWPVRVYEEHGIFLGLGQVAAGGQLRPRLILVTKEELGR